MTEPDFIYDEATGRYRATSGQFVSRASVRAWLDAVLIGSDSRTRALADALRTGQLSLTDWEIAMRAEIKMAHLRAAFAARGGPAFMTQADYGRVGQIVRQNYDFLEAWAQQIRDGLPIDGRFAARATLYDQAGRSTYEAFRAAEMERQGYDEVLNIRHALDSCPGCLDETAAGWQSVDAATPPGNRDCLGRCRCAWTFRRSESGAVAT